MRQEIREIHDLTGKVATHYREKYGDRAEEILEEAARFCEEKGDLHRRNRLLRLRDELLFCSLDSLTK